MTARLASRDRPIPNGLRYYQPETQKAWTGYWQFNQLVSDIIQYRVGNQRQLARFNLPTDPATVAEQVDQFNAAICVQLGWAQYVASAGPLPAPKMMPQATSGQSSLLAAAAAKVKGLAAGYKSIRSWSADGFPPIDPALAESRAAICVACPFNQEGDFTEFFTLPFAEAVKRDAEALNQRGLKTSHDAALKVCSQCACPLRLKVQIPMEPYINQTLTPELVEKLRQAPGGCWQLSESNK